MFWRNVSIVMVLMSAGATIWTLAYIDLMNRRIVWFSLVCYVLVIIFNSIIAMFHHRRVKRERAS